MTWQKGVIEGGLISYLALLILQTSLAQKGVIEGGLISYLALLILQTSLAQSKGKDSETLIVVSMDGLRW